MIFGKLFESLKNRFQYQSSILRMLATLFCYQSCNLSKYLRDNDYNNHEYTKEDIKQLNETFILQEFPNCACLDNPPYKINEYEITDDQPTCILGNFIIGADQPFTATVGFTTNIINESFHINETNDNFLGVLQHPGKDPERFRVIYDFAITKIQCKSFPCKVQLFNINYQSYLITSVTNNEHASTTEAQGIYSFVSTKSSGSITQPYEFTYNKIEKNNTLKGTYKFIQTNTIIANFNTKSFTYKKGKNITLYYELDGQGQHTKEQKGSLGSCSFFAGGTIYQAEPGIESFSFIDKLELEWKESKKAASEDKKVMLIPEFEASLSVNGGVFTKENIDQPFPLQNGGENDKLPPGAIAGIVIACIAVVAIIAVCIWLFALGGIKKCKKDKSDSSSNSKKEQEEK